jgi:hypothetical protein
MIALSYLTEIEFNNSRGILLKAIFSGNYGVNGTGDLLNLNPTQNNGVDGGITDPNFDYNQLLEQPTTTVGVWSESLGGYYCQINTPAVPTLKNIGIRVFSPTGAGELATNAAYAAAITGGSAIFMLLLPKYQ